MRIFLFCLVVVASGCASRPRYEPVEPTDRPYLWRVDGANRSVPFFLYGTQHTSDDRVVTLPDSVVEALMASNEVYTESGNEEVRKTEMTPRGGAELSDTIGIDRVRRASRRLGLPVPYVERFSAENVLFALALSSGNRRPATLVLDDYIVKLAKRLELPVRALDDVAHAVSLAESLKTQFTSFLISARGGLKEAFDSVLSKSSSSDHVEDYLAGDLQDASGLEVLLDEETFEQLTTARNRRFSQLIVQRAGQLPDESIFFAFGHAHLAGEEGVLALLEAEGFHLRRLGARDDPLR